VIDVVQQINAVRRAVADRVLDVGEARSVTIARSYDAPIADVWDACTNPERIPRWFLPVSGELRVGGRYQLEGNAGGTIGRCDPPESFAATWEYGGQVSWIEVRLSPEGNGRTRFALEHITPSDDGGHWDQFGAGATGVGWDLMLMGLALHLASGHSADRNDAQAWSASAEGRRFMSLSSERWCDAAIAAGAEEGAARAAAERTTAAYTGAENQEPAVD
jgi:uncharacterized protein YndB with AHSA1/START domain